MDIARSFSYMFKDSSWFFKVFLGGIFLILSAVVVGLPFILGYEIEHIRGVAEQKESILPEWKNMRKLFKEGLIVLCAALVYATLLLSFIVAVYGVPATILMLAGTYCSHFFLDAPRSYPVYKTFNVFLMLLNHGNFETLFASSLLVRHIVSDGVFNDCRIVFFRLDVDDRGMAVCRVLGNLSAVSDSWTTCQTLTDAHHDDTI